MIMELANANVFLALGGMLVIKLQEQERELSKLAGKLVPLPWPMEMTPSLSREINIASIGSTTGSSFRIV